MLPLQTTAVKKRNAKLLKSRGGDQGQEAGESQIPDIPEEVSDKLGDGHLSDVEEAHEERSETDIEAQPVRTSTEEKASLPGDGRPSANSNYNPISPR